MPRDKINIILTGYSNFEATIYLNFWSFEFNDLVNNVFVMCVWHRQVQSIYNLYWAIQETSATATNIMSKLKLNCLFCCYGVTHLIPSDTIPHEKKDNRHEKNLRKDSRKFKEIAILTERI